MKAASVAFSVFFDFVSFLFFAFAILLVVCCKVSATIERFIFDSQLDIFQCNNCQLECVTFYICIFNLQTLINSLAILIVNTCIQQIFFLNGYAVHWGLFRDLKTPHLKATLHDLKRLMQNCDFGDWRRF